MAEYKRNGVHVTHFDGAFLWSKMEASNDIESLLLEPFTNIPALICIDDLEMVCGNRGDRIQSLASINKLLEHVNTNDRIAFIGTTRNMESIDFSIRTHGRLDREMYIPIPNHQDRKQIIQMVMDRLHIDKTLLDRLNNVHISLLLYSLC